MKLKTKKLPKLIIFIVLFVCIKSYAGFSDNEARFLFQAGTYTFTAKSTNKDASVSGFGAYTFGFDYCIASHFSIIASYNYLKSSGIGGDTSVGIDVAAKYYPFTFSGYNYYKNQNLDIKMTQLWRPYVGIGMRQRQFVLVLTTNYYGYGFFTGVDYQISDRYFLNAEVRDDFYFGGSSGATANMTNILIGAGYQF